MDIKQALQICTEYGEDYGYAGLLETMEAMDEAYGRDELTDRQRTAFRIAMAGFRRLFAPA